MDRLTIHNEYDHGALNFVKEAEGRAVDINMILKHLGAYEDTGLTPDEINTFHKAISELSGELAKYKEAEKQGRLIVLPEAPDERIGIAHEILSEASRDKRGAALAKETHNG